MKRQKFIKLTAMGLSASMLPSIVSSMPSIGLPKVLIIGDSISIGYTPFVKEIMKDRADVSRPMKSDGKPENCEGTTKGVANIDRWIGDTKWDVIHFNFGLHDLKHVDKVTGKNSNNVEDPHQAELKQYKRNLKKITDKLLATNAKLVFATTTPYPEGTTKPLRDFGDETQYNNVALKIMKKKGIVVNDLHTLMLPRMQELQRPVNVHFTEEGSRVLADQVVNSIASALK